MSEGTTPEGLPTAPRAAPLRRWAGRVAGALAVVLLLYAVYRERANFAAAVSEVRVSTLVLAFLAVLLGLVTNMMSWRAAMASAGAGVPVGPGARVFFLSQLGKYVPGSVWPVLAQVELTRERGIPRSRSTSAALMAMLVGVVTSAVLGSTLVIMSRGDALARYWWVLAAVPVGIAVLHPPILRRLLNLAAHILRRPSPDVPLDGRRIRASAGWSLVMWTLFGCHAWLLADDIAPGRMSYPMMTGAFALAWVVGFLIVLAPAGVGVREAALVVAVGGELTPAGALALALVSRVVMTVGDGLFAALAVLVERGRRRRAESAAHLAAGEAGPVPPPR